MKVIVTPLRLQLAASLLVFSVPLAVLQIVLLSGAPWWDLPMKRMGIASLFAAALFVPLAQWICNGKRWALGLTGLTGILWFLFSLLSALQLRSFWLEVFVIILGAYWLLLWNWLGRETGKSFFDPQMNWYHGSPERWPDLNCEIEGEGAANFSVCRLDREGLFIFRSRMDDIPSAQVEDPLLKKKKLNLVLRFKGKEFRGPALPVRALSARRGYGLRFDRISPDQQKDLGDFVEALKGEGYVQ